MSTTFDLGVKYEFTFSNGDRVTFTPAERLKNGNWRGKATAQEGGRRESSPKTKTVFDPPALAWRRCEQ
jgi:hypothetical protein